MNKKIRIALELKNLVFSYAPYEADFLIYSCIKVKVNKYYYKSDKEQYYNNFKGEKISMPILNTYNKIPPALSMEPVIPEYMYKGISVQAILTIEIYDQKTRRLLWQGMTNEELWRDNGMLIWISFGEKIDKIELLLSAIKKIIENFPPPMKYFFAEKSTD